MPRAVHDIVGIYVHVDDVKPMEDSKLSLDLLHETGTKLEWGAFFMANWTQSLNTMRW